MFEAAHVFFGQKKKEKKTGKSGDFLESLVKYEAQIPLTLCVCCAADYFTGGSLQVIHHVHVMGNVAKPLDFISNSRGQRSRDFTGLQTAAPTL